MILFWWLHVEPCEQVGFCDPGDMLAKSAEITDGTNTKVLALSARILQPTIIADNLLEINKGPDKLAAMGL